MATQDTDPDDIDALETVPDEDDADNTGQIDPGIDRHDFAGEWESVWEDVSTDPAESLPNLEDIVRRLLERHGYVLDTDDPASRGEEVEVLAPYWSARESAEMVRDGEDIDDADVVQAIADLKEIYESLIDRVEGDAR